MVLKREKINKPGTLARDSCKVVNRRVDLYDTYIGRPSKWGNPFSHKKGTKAEFKVKNRKEAIQSYEKWITEGEGKHLLDDLHELEGMVLGCWCKPYACHGDILVKLVNKYKRDE